MEKQVFGKNHPFPARLVEYRLLNKPGTAKDTRHYVVDISGSGLAYTCGDSLGVFPTNAEEAVEEVIAALRASPEDFVKLPREDEEITLGEALCKRLSLAQPSKKALLAFKEKVKDPGEKAALEALLQPEAREAMKKYLANREFIDLLTEYRSARFSPREFVLLLRKLVPRLYSIASSPTLYPEAVHLTVATVRYETNHRRRIGVCSTYLSDRVPLHEPVLPVFVARSHFGLPADDSADIIMVGPGTGIAPFRAFLQERVARKAAGRSWIFFGDQHAATDYLYGEEFEDYLAKGHLSRIDLAWSRDQDYKIYVQDKIREKGAEIWNWIDHGAYFLVCGDARRMAPDVDAALHKVVEEHGGKTKGEAKIFIKQLKKEKRYLRDVY